MGTTAFRRLPRVMLLGASITLAHPAGAAALAEPAVIVHLGNEAKLPIDWVALARQRAAEVYESAGVTLRWNDIDNPDQAAAPVQLVVILASGRLTDVICGVNHIAPDAMGAAMVGSRRMAYVFVDRIADLAARKHLMVSAVVGEVMAHELGHLLLPDPSHTKAGVMRPSVEVRAHTPLRFTDAQAVALRTRLAQE